MNIPALRADHYAIRAVSCASGCIRQDVPEFPPESPWIETMLTFIGLGLYDASDISEKGLICIRNADHVYLEIYTSTADGCIVSGT